MQVEKVDLNVEIFCAVSDTFWLSFCDTSSSVPGLHLFDVLTTESHSYASGTSNILLQSWTNALNTGVYIMLLRSTSVVYQCCHLSTEV